MASTRQNFENELNELHQEILRLGSIVELAIDMAIEALVNQNANIANQVISGDTYINKIELDIENKCVTLIATQQPMAKDLRRISACLKSITDLERMADYAVDIARIAVRIDSEPHIKPLVDIPNMAKLTQRMVRDCLDSYVYENVELAKKVGNDDQDVDHLYSKVFNDLVEIMAKEPKNIKQGAHLLFVAKALERIADHATNIGEDVIYLVTGERKDINS